MFNFYCVVLLKIFQRTKYIERKRFILRKWLTQFVDPAYLTFICRVHHEKRWA